MTATDRLRLVSTAAKIAAAIAWERWGPEPKLASAASVPSSAEAMTVEWLTSVLCAGTEAKVVAVRVLGGDDGTSARRAVEVRYDAAGREAGLPTRLFSKSTATLGSRMLLGITGIVEGESVFYNTVRAGLTLRSPRGYYSGYDPRSHRSLLLLEDLSVRGWTFPNPQHNPVSREDAEDMVSELASYHGALWDSPRFGSDLRRLRPSLEWQESLNRKVGFGERAQIGLERARDVLPGHVYDRRGEVRPAFMRSLHMHAAAPNTLLHQDLHLGNWLRDPTGRMGLYDWQCVARGHWALDYSYAIGGCLTPENRREWEEDLLRLYLARLADAGVEEVPSFDDAWLAYRQQALHGFVFGLFTLGGRRFEPELQPRAYTVAAIERLSTQIADLNTLAAVPA